MKREELVRKVNLYLERARQDPLVENHPLDGEGYWKIMSGTKGDYGGRNQVEGIFHGKFIDVVAYAVQSWKFYADWCSHDNPRNCNHGKVEKIKVRELKYKGLVEAINSSKDRKLR